MDDIDKFLEGFKSTATKSGGDDIDKFLEGFKSISQTSQVQPSISTAPIPGSDTPADYERTKQFQQEQSFLNKPGQFRSDIGETYKRKVGENFEAGREATSTALGDIGSNLPASGIG